MDRPPDCGGAHRWVDERMPRLLVRNLPDPRRLLQTTTLAARNPRALAWAVPKGRIRGWGVDADPGLQRFFNRR